MGQYNWIDGTDFSIRHFYLMDRWLLAMIFKHRENKNTKEVSEHAVTLATLLKRHEDLIFVIKKRAPEASKGLEALLDHADDSLTGDALRKREIALMEAMETDVIYMEPEIMASQANYITAWDESHLHDLVDVTDKVVLDLGAGTGRLTFAAAPKAKRVYASEPVDRLREYMRDKVKTEGITNVKVQDGVVLDIPHEDNTFDVVMSGHVVGDHYEDEINEMMRVTKDGGKIVICNGDDDIKRQGPDKELTRRGFQAFYHESTIGGDIYNYTKKVIK